MSRKQFVPHSGSHEKKTTRTEQKAELAKQREDYDKQKAEFDAAQAAQQAAQEQLALPTATAEDKEQLRKLAIYSAIGLFALLALMFYFFVVRE